MGFVTEFAVICYSGPRKLGTSFLLIPAPCQEAPWTGLLEDDIRLAAFQRVRSILLPGSPNLLEVQLATGSAALLSATGAAPATAARLSTPGPRQSPDPVFAKF